MFVSPFGIVECFDAFQFSNDNFSAFIEPSLTTVSQPVEEIGKVATELLIDQINRDVKDWKAVTKMLETELIIRDSSK